MIDIYTEKIDSKDWIIKNDLFFNLNTSNEEMSDNEVALIKQIDDAKLTPDKHIETKYIAQYSKASGKSGVRRGMWTECA